MIYSCVLDVEYTVIFIFSYGSWVRPFIPAELSVVAFNHLGNLVTGFSKMAFSLSLENVGAKLCFYLYP